MAHTRYTALLLALVTMLLLLALPTTHAYADNSKSAQHVMVCVAIYHGESFRAEMAILDRTFNEQSMRVMMVDRWLLPEIAGKYHHEYFDYPNPPNSVHERDLDSLKCRVSNTNVPLEP